jgi:glycosyltransferase involved in cell wall biosynthesis
MLRVLHLTPFISYEKTPGFSFQICKALEDINLKNLCLYTQRGPHIIPPFEYKKCKSLRMGIFEIPSISFIIQEINRFKPDIILIHSKGIFALLPVVASKLLGKKATIITDYWPRTKENLSLIRKILWKTIFSINCLLSWRILSWTNYEKREILKLFPFISPRKIEVVPLGIDFKEIEKFRKKFKFKRKNYIITVSHWVEEKNLEKTIEVFNIVRRYLKCKLIIVGPFESKNYEKRIKDIVKRLKIKKNVIFKGVKTGEDLFKEYSQAKVFHFHSFLPFALVFIEAMAFGLPCVSHRGDVVREIVKDRKTGFLNDNLREQAKSIIKLLTDRKIYKRVSNNAYIEAKKYDWEKIALKLKNIFR